MSIPDLRLVPQGQFFHIASVHQLVNLMISMQEPLSVLIFKLMYNLAGFQRDSIQRQLTKHNDRRKSAPVVKAWFLIHIFVKTRLDYTAHPICSAKQMKDNYGTKKNITVLHTKCKISQ